MTKLKLILTCEKSRGGSNCSNDRLPYNGILFVIASSSSSSKSSSSSCLPHLLLCCFFFILLPPFSPWATIHVKYTIHFDHPKIPPTVVVLFFVLTLLLLLHHLRRHQRPIRYNYKVDLITGCKGSSFNRERETDRSLIPLISIPQNLFIPSISISGLL